jgi:rhamnosyltransferase subunit B
LTRKVVLATVGSLGDLHPFIALGRALHDLGVNAVIACSPEYRAKVEAAGVAYHPLRPGFDDIQRELGMDRAQLTRAVVKRSRFLFRQLVLPHLGAAYEDMMKATEDADLILSSSLAFAARLAAEKRGIPWIAVVLQPMMFFSSYDPPVIPKAEALSALLRSMGPGPTRLALWIIKRGVNVLFRPLRTLRAGLGLEPSAQNPLFEGQFAKGGAIGLYSRLLGDVQPDYPHPTSIVGFATFDADDGSTVGLDPALQKFLDDGPAPLVFTLGSLIVNSPGRFYGHGARAARNLRMRAVLLAGEQGCGELAHLQSADVFIAAYAPHSVLFPRAAAIIHHGGIGTLAQALRSGHPQLIVPYFADQPDNAARARRLGVARILPPRRFSASAASRHLARLLGGGRYLEQARIIGKSLSAEDGAARAARIVLDRLEELGRE